MGRISCKKHGDTGPEMVCVHAARGLKTGVPVETKVVEVDEILLPVVNLCRECLNIWHQMTAEEETEKFIEAMVIPVCMKCFDEARSK